MSLHSTPSKENLYQYANIQSAQQSSPQFHPSSLILSVVPYVNAGTEPLPYSETTEEKDQSYIRQSRIFFFVLAVSAIIILVLQCYMYAVINIHKQSIDSHQSYAEISIFLSLFIFASVYQVLLTFVGLRTKNMLLLGGLCIFYACMLVYTGIQYEEIGQKVTRALQPEWATPTRATNIATICVIAATLLIQAYLIYFVLRHNVKWFRYKKIGGDPHLKQLYLVFQIHRSLLIFDFFFFLGFTIQFIVIMIADKTSTEFILTVCVLPLTILILVASDIAASREIWPLQVASIMVYLAGCAYVLFKMIRLYTKYTSAYNIGFEPGSYFPGRKSLLTFGVITLILLFATVAVEFWLLFNINRGLLPLVNSYYSWFSYKLEAPTHKEEAYEID